MWEELAKLGSIVYIMCTVRPAGSQFPKAKWLSGGQEMRESLWGGHFKGEVSTQIARNVFKLCAETEYTHTAQLPES